MMMMMMMMMMIVTTSFSPKPRPPYLPPCDEAPGTFEQCMRCVDDSCAGDDDGEGPWWCGHATTNDLCLEQRGAERFTPRVVCSGLEKPADGGVSKTAALAGEEAYFFCDDGYELQGRTSATCSETGSWWADTNDGFPDLPVCVEIPPPPLSLATGGTACQIVCYESFCFSTFWQFSVFINDESLTGCSSPLSHFSPQAPRLPPGRRKASSPWRQPLFRLRF